jgi:trehalose synthase-fused probable maltokinase
VTTIQLRDQNALNLVLDAECRRVLEQEILPGYLLNQRWYAAKGDGEPQVRVETFIPLGPNGIVLLLAVNSDREARYFLPVRAIWDNSLPEKVAMATLRAQSTSGLLIDALVDDAFVRCLLGHIGAQRDQGEADRLIFKRSRSFRPLPGFADDAELRRPNVEQSNTSIMAGAAILKAFRKLEAGIHPEVEIGTFLTDTVGFKNVPQLLGTVECVRQGNEPIVLCVLQSLIDDSVDGWSVVAKGLRAVTAVAKGKDSAHLLSLAGRLGLRAAELHRAFAEGTEPAFVPEPISTQWLTRWSQTLEDNVQAAFSLLEGLRVNGTNQKRPQLDSALSRHEDLIRRIHDLMPSETSAVRTRIHGDLHLGQTLVTVDDVFIVDFEGEPMRTLAERRAKYLPMRDVAGMLRSFDYACAMEIRRRKLNADEEGQFLREVAKDMKSIFLERYRGAMTGCQSFPQDLFQANAFLTLGLIEKAVYEITYEAANRPDWVNIPIDALIVLLDDKQQGFGASAASLI